MKRLLLSLLFIFVLSNFSNGQNSLPKNFAGVYQWCLVRCETIKINNDFTFEFLFERKDLYKGSLKGNWKILEGNKIHLEARDEERIKILREAKEQDGGDIDPAYPTEIDQTFIYKKKKLCNLFRGNIEFCYKKLSNKKAKKLFPKSE